MMVHDYQVTGMTCSGCESKVKSNLLTLPAISAVEVSKETNVATITMEKHIGLTALQEALGGASSKYQISALTHNELIEETKSYWETYKPVLLLFGYISLTAIIASWQGYTLKWMDFMCFFMAGFFLSFSFFKLINLKAFADSYAMYDIVAKRFKPWAYLYAFIELGLGLAFGMNLNAELTNWLTLIIMSISLIGVVQSVLNKRKIQCACLGAVFNLPMSALTIIEDLLMIAMSAILLILM